MHPAGGTKPTSTELRSFLSTKLPGFMVPARFVFLAKFPLSARDKVDILHGLNRPGNRSCTYGSRNQVEEELTTIWMKAFRFEGIGVQDDFLDLGGDSLLAAQVLTDIKDQFGRNLPLALLAECRTIEQMAKLLEQGSGQPASSIITFQSKGSRPPLFLFPGKDGDTFYFRDLTSPLG